ncbi:MAG: LPS assembly protein LptD [Verrucomicrobiota bacterium]
MKKLLAALLAVAAIAFAGSVFAQVKPELELEIRTLSNSGDGQIEYDSAKGTFVYTNGLMLKYGDAVLTADAVRGNTITGEIFAVGHVHILRDDLAWTGDSVQYNYKTRQMLAEQFRTGYPPASVFAAGENLGAENLGRDPTNRVATGQNTLTNGIYTARNAFITTDDIANPAEKIRASSIKIIPGKSIEARNAVLYLGNVPVFYFPYYKQPLDGNMNHFNFVPGYRTSYGEFLLSSYTWQLNDAVDGVLRADYRTSRGAAGGADLNLHLGQWGEAALKYYYLHDKDPNYDNPAVVPPANRQLFGLGYNATPYTNLNFNAQVNYLSDSLILHDFFQGAYRQNPQPSTFLEINRLFDNFSVDVLTVVQINDFFETVERLPDVQLTGFRQQVFDTPLYYESKSSIGYYNREFAVTNGVPTGLDYAAGRFDTYHQVTLPQTFFGWLNVIPRVGGRWSYYGEETGPGGTNDATPRAVFNTGAEATFKVSRLWASATNGWLALDGLRHIAEPSLNYVYVPSPSVGPAELPQFDYVQPSLRPLPIEFPDYNSIDSIDSQNVIRMGLRNRLQTKRAGQLENFLFWDVYTDWRLTPDADQSAFADLYSDVVFRPRTWFTFESEVRYDVSLGLLAVAQHTLTLRPNEIWSWSLSHWYLNNEVSAVLTPGQTGNSLLISTLYYKLNENWGIRATHQYELREGIMQAQSYAIYRDLRSWTAALALRLQNNQGSPNDVTVAFTFSLKAAPKTGVGGDTVHSAGLLGY